uniref:Succinate dehydrogenase [ubiquinone] cytochrome b small subunit n=1 Tax=Glossina palpalis gambiensis TaxID=67801 RepID=A0A1B0BXM3_9MUSC
MTLQLALRNAPRINEFPYPQPFTRTIALSSPRLSAAGGNHTTLWTLERVVSLALLGVIPAAFLVPSQTLDALMAVSLVLHSRWGIEAMITDYVRPGIVGNVLPKVSHASLLLLSLATLGGLFYLIYNDIGIAKSVKLLNLFMKNKIKYRNPKFVESPCKVTSRSQLSTNSARRHVSTEGLIKFLKSKITILEEDHDRINQEMAEQKELLEKALERSKVMEQQRDQAFMK